MTYIYFIYKNFLPTVIDSSSYSNPYFEHFGNVLLIFKNTQKPINIVFFKYC